MGFSRKSLASHTPAERFKAFLVDSNINILRSMEDRIGDKTALPIALLEQLSSQEIRPKITNEQAIFYASRIGDALKKALPEMKRPRLNFETGDRETGWAAFDKSDVVDKEKLQQMIVQMDAIVGKTPYAQRIAAVSKAHAKGVLFAHMFEFYESAADTRLKELCDVMNGVKGSRFKNAYRDVWANPDGYQGLATTAIKAGLPVTLWASNGGVGLLLDGEDKSHIKPVHVASEDSWSRTENGRFSVTASDSPYFKPIIDMQNIGCEISHGHDHLDFTDPKLPEHIANARLALKKFWEILGSMDWNDYIKGHMRNEKGLNEVNVIAHLRGVKGLIVDESVFDTWSPEAQAEGKAKNIVYAKQTRERLYAMYPEVFPEGSLPIFTYNPKRAQEQLMAVADERIVQVNPSMTARVNASDRGADGVGGRQ